MHESREDRERFDSTVGRSSGSLARLDDLDDYEVADHDEDIRGWDVCTVDGRKVGKVDELIVDTSALKARYMEVKVDKDVAGADDERWALVPVGTARLNEKKKEVLIDQLPTRALMTKEERTRQPLSREVELSLREQYGATSTGLAADAALESEDDFYAGSLYDDAKLRRRRPSDPYLIRQTGGTDYRI